MRNCNIINIEELCFVGIADIDNDLVHKLILNFNQVKTVHVVVLIYRANGTRTNLLYSWATINFCIPLPKQTIDLINRMDPI